MLLNPKTINYRLFYLHYIGRVLFQYKVFLILPFFIQIPVFSANSTDPDQMSHFAGSYLGLQCSVCQCPLYGMLGLNWLKALNTCFAIRRFCNDPTVSTLV